MYCLRLLKAASSTFKWIKQQPSHLAETQPDTGQIKTSSYAGQMRHTPECWFPLESTINYLNRDYWLSYRTRGMRDKFIRCRFVLILEPRTIMAFSPWWLEREVFPKIKFAFKVLSAPFFPIIWHFPEYQPASCLWLIHDVDCAALIMEKNFFFTIFFFFFFSKWVSTGMWVQFGRDL